MVLRLWLTVTVVLIFDQITKVGFSYAVHTTPALTGLGGGPQSSAYLALCVALIGLVLLWAHHPWWAAGLAIGGLLSNLLDRIVYGGVRNPVSYGPADWNWADLFSLVGLAICAVCFVLNTWRGGDAR